jgi:adenylate kinase family enzyme
VPGNPEVRKEKNEVCVTEGEKQVERLGARIKPSVRSWIDNVIVPSLIEEWLVREESAKCLAGTPRDVAQFERSKMLSAEEVA